MEFSISRSDDLGAARQRRMVDRVTIYTQRLKHRGLLPYALKYGLWALKPGGVLEIWDEGSNNYSMNAFAMPFEAVRHCVFGCLGSDVAIEAVDLARKHLVFRRQLPLTPSGWSAGVVFSGSDGEIPQLLACLDGLECQPELSEAMGGEIIVCGPRRDLSFLSDRPHVRYLEFDVEASPRLMITAKKNALVLKMRNPRVVVLHTRIVLDPGCLAAIPEEFEIASLDIEIASGAGRESYLSFGTTDVQSFGWMPRRMPASMRQIGKTRYLDLLRHGQPYIDGGAFIVRRDVFLRCQLDEHLSWGEAEDMEWCRRAVSHGFLVDFIAGATALSTTNKLPSRATVLSPVVRAAVRKCNRGVRWLAGFLRHSAETAVGRR